MITLEIKCRRCAGTGLESDSDGYPGAGNVSCIACDGDGLYSFGTLDLSDLEDKIDDIMGKCNDIKEKVDEL